MFIELFSMPFIQRALIAGVLVGFLSGFYGAFIVQRKMSFLGSGLSHAAFGGIALGMLLGIEPLWIAIPFTIVVSIAITYIKEKTNLGADTSIGILFSVSVALGIIFLALKTDYSIDAFAYLFGSILSVMEVDLYITIGVSLLTIISGKFLWQLWAYSTFDEELARADRLKVSMHDYLLAVLTSITIVVSVKLVGIILIAAYLVIPPAAARLVSNSFIKMSIISVIVGIFSSILGLFISFFLDLPSGGVIILIQALFFGLAYFFGKDSRK